MKFRVSIIEDDRQTLLLLADIVTGASDLELISQYDRCAAAIKAIPKEKPDVVLVDINLPDSTGVEVVRRLKPDMPDTQFLMLTVYEDSGYLLKNARRIELLEAIAQVLAGGSPMSNGIARKVVQSFSRPAAPAENLVALSPREQAVLDLLSKGYLYKEIAESLGVSVPTVNTHIRHIYGKLQVRSRSQAIIKYLAVNR
jgi:DNA-binding NarL/FixJ family response regulator